MNQPVKLKVTIERIETFTKVRREWRKLTDDQTAEKQYGYVDDQWPQTENEKVYEQTITGGDAQIAAVIKAVNGL